MSDQPPDIDALVRAYLLQTAARTDVGPLYDRITATAAPPRETVLPRPRSRPWARRIVVGLAAASVLVIAFLAGGGSGKVQASAEALVRDAQKAHALPIDRCYLVETRFDDGPRLPFLPETRVNRLWTRGDRFWIESTTAKRRWAWGRDETGSLWLAVGPHIGLRFEDAEVPEGLALACDVCSMKMETLLNEVLRNFDLQRDAPPPGEPSATNTVRAEPKPGHEITNLRSALLELDTETKVLRRVVLRRTFRGGRNATTTFTLVDTQTQDPTIYQLEGHLEPPSRIFSRTDEPQRRLLHLGRLFGAGLAGPVRKEQ